MGKADREALEEKIRKGKEKEMKEKIKKKKEKMKKERVSFLTDFKKFITKGNVLDLAVGMVIATAFNAIVNGLVKHIITPFVTYFTSGVSIDEWKYVLKPEVVVDEVVTEAEIAIQYGLWLQSIVDFFIIALSVFTAVRIIRNMERKLNAKELEKKAAADAAAKAEADAKAAAEAEIAAAKAAEKKAIEDEFYANVREQAALLREIRDNIKK